MTTEIQQSKESLIRQYERDSRISSLWDTLSAAALRLQKEQYRQTLDSLTSSDLDVMTESESEKEDRARILDLRDRFQAAEKVFHEQCGRFSIPVLPLTSDDICSFYK